MQKKINNSDIGLGIHQALIEGKHPLRAHQYAAVERAATHLFNPVGQPLSLPEGQRHDPDSGLKSAKVDDHFLIVSATGTGKTRILGALMDSSGAHTLLLTPRVLLNEQAMREFCEEMDIPRDQIGLIDGNVRGKAREAALQKPYLISTYQSLPALVEAEGDDYRLREELGHRNLILLDEAHTAQGPQTAAILNSLKRQAILGGVTATEAGVSHTLFDGQAPIFNLNLVQAIDDGLLARGVRTGVIDVRIDEDWVDAMLNTPLGKEYSRADLERFSQAPGALKAMAQFHLSYADDELGRIDRFPTLVFTQGVKAAQDGAELFNRMAEAAGSPARAGYVSGDMDATQRDAALSAFASGRIKVLFNDKMLEMGYDLPEATVAYSLKPTQYRHTAEQQLGRITRRQPGDYSDKYGMDKVALAINVRPTGTTPFLFGEVLGNRPARYAHDWEPRYDKERGAGGTANPLLGADVDIHMQYDDLDRIIAGAPRQDQAQEKPEWMLGAVETAKAISVNPPRFANIFQQLSAKGEAARQPGQSEVTVELDGKPVTLGWYKSHTHTTWFIHEASLAVLAAHFGKSLETVQPKPEGMLSSKEASQAIAIKGLRLAPLWQQLSAAAEAARQPGQSEVTVELDGKPITLGWYKSGGKTTWFIHEASLPVLAAFFGKSLESVQPKPEGMLGSKEVMKALGISPSRIAPLWQQLTAAAEAARQPGQSEVAVELDGKPVTLGWYKSGGQTAWYVHEASLPVLAAYFGKSLETVQPKPEGMLRAVDAAKAISLSPSSLATILQQLSVEAEEKRQPGQSEVAVELDGKPVTLGWYKSGGQTAWYVHENSLPVLASHFGKSLESVQPKPEGMLRSEEAAKAIGSSPPRLAPLWQQLTAAAEAARPPEQSEVTVELDGKPVTLGWYKSGGQTTWYVHEASLPVLAAHFGKSLETVQPKPEGMLSSKEASQAIGIKGQRLAPLWQQLSAAAEAARIPRQSEVTVELDGKPVTLGWYKNHTHTTWFIHEASLPVLASHFGKEGKALTGSFAEREQARNGARDNTAQAEPTSWVSRVSGSKNDIDGDDKSGHNR